MHDRPGDPCVVVPDQLPDKEAVQSTNSNAFLPCGWNSTISRNCPSLVKLLSLWWIMISVCIRMYRYMQWLMLLPGLSQLQWHNCHQVTRQPVTATTWIHFRLELWQELPFNVTMSLLYRLQRAITPKGEKTENTAIMQTSNPSLDHHGDRTELSDPSKNPQESKIEAGEDSASEDDVYVGFWPWWLLLLMITVPIQMYKPAFPTRTRTCPSTPFALGFWGSLEPWC